MSTCTTDEINAANALLSLSKPKYTADEINAANALLSLSKPKYTADEMNAANALLSLANPRPSTTTTTPNPTSATLLVNTIQNNHSTA